MPKPRRLLNFSCCPFIINCDWYSAFWRRMLFDQIVTLPFNTLKGLLNIARFLPHIIQLPFFNGELICDDGYRSQDICIVLAGNARFSTRCIQIVDLVLQLTNLLACSSTKRFCSTRAPTVLPYCRLFQTKTCGKFFSYFVDLTGVFWAERRACSGFDTSHTGLLLPASPDPARRQSGQAHHSSGECRQMLRY